MAWHLTFARGAAALERRPLPRPDSEYDG